uniref:RING-type E3 ubiquitin transferase n=1 Tax=Oreochromis niloticus TaxID=8128 RepID=A0A669F076_ORENI
MEKVADSVLFPCMDAASGCNVTLPHTNLTKHKELCEFQPCSCPVPRTSCRWQGSLDALVPHLMQHVHHHTAGSSSTFILSSAAPVNTRTPPSVCHTHAPPTPPAAVKHCSSSSFSTFSTFKSPLFFSEHIFALSGPPYITLHFPASQSTLPSTCHMTPLSLPMLYSCF